MISRGYPLKTNKTSNTAFRAYGQPQAAFFMQTAVAHLARETGTPLEDVTTPFQISTHGIQFMRRNFAKVGDTRVGGAKVINDAMIECFDDCRQFSNFDEKQKEIADFNKLACFDRGGVCNLQAKQIHSSWYCNGSDAVWPDSRWFHGVSGCVSADLSGWVCRCVYRRFRNGPRAHNKVPASRFTSSRSKKLCRLCSVQIVFLGSD